MIITMYSKSISQEENWLKHFTFTELLRPGKLCITVLNCTLGEASKLTMLINLKKNANQMKASYWYGEDITDNSKA